VTDELADRRAAVLARLQAARDEAATRRLDDTPVDHVGEQIEASKRAHPSNPK
jgi:hypothetical protein